MAIFGNDEKPVRQGGAKSRSLSESLSHRLYTNLCDVYINQVLPERAASSVGKRFGSF